MIDKIKLVVSNTPQGITMSFSVFLTPGGVGGLSPGCGQSAFKL